MKCVTFIAPPGSRESRKETGKSTDLHAEETFKKKKISQLVARSFRWQIVQSKPEKKKEEKNYKGVGSYMYFNWSKFPFFRNSMPYFFHSRTQ